jgi:copper resistance protein B
MNFLMSIILLIGYSFAQHPDHHVKNDPTEVEPGEKGFPKDYKRPPPPEVVTGIKKYATDSKTTPQENFGVVPIHDNQLFGFLFVDRLEQRLNSRNDITLWDITGRVGNNFHRLFLESEGEYGSGQGRFKESRNELLYGYAIAPFWDMQVGYRHDFISARPDRNFAVFSFQGMAPFAFEMDVAGYLSEDGDISGILEMEYTFLLTQRAQLIPRVELEAALQETEAYHVGRGFNGFELGLRLSYQIQRELAPYLGLSWEQKTFGTRRLLEREGEDSSEGVFLLGARIIF